MSTHARTDEPTSARRFGPCDVQRVRSVLLRGDELIRQASRSRQDQKPGYCSRWPHSNQRGGLGPRTTRSPWFSIPIDHPNAPGARRTSWTCTSARPLLPLLIGPFRLYELRVPGHVGSINILSRPIERRPRTPTYLAAISTSGRTVVDGEAIWNRLCLGTQEVTTHPSSRLGQSHHERLARA